MKTYDNIILTVTDPNYFGLIAKENEFEYRIVAWFDHRYLLCSKNNSYHVIGNVPLPTNWTM